MGALRLLLPAPLTTDVLKRPVRTQVLLHAVDILDRIQYALASATHLLPDHQPGGLPQALRTASAVLDVLDIIGGGGRAAPPVDMCWTAETAPVYIIEDWFGLRWRCLGCQTIEVARDEASNPFDAARAHAHACRSPLIVSSRTPASVIATALSSDSSLRPHLDQLRDGAARASSLSRARESLRADAAVVAESAVDCWEQDAIGGRVSGPTAAATATAVMAGLDDGDPAVFDKLPACPAQLDPVFVELYTNTCDTAISWSALTDDERDLMLQAYQEAFVDACEAAVRVACLRVLDITP